MLGFFPEQCSQAENVVVGSQARNKAGQVGYVPEKYLQFPTSSSLLSMLQSLAALDTRSHTSNNSTEADLVPGSLNGDSNGKFLLSIHSRLSWLLKTLDIESGRFSQISWSHTVIKDGKSPPGS